MLRRRSIATALASLAATAALPWSAHAQSTATRRIVVPFAPGGPIDVTARLLAERVKDTLGPVVIENRPGAGGNLGVDLVAKAPADGLTIGIAAVAMHAINPWLFAKLPFDPIKDFTPVTQMVRIPNVLVMNAEVAQRLKITSLKDFIAYAKANPGKINYGSAGQGTPQNITCELFKMMTGVNLVHVPYKGGAPAVADLISGHVQVVFAPLSESIQQVKAGKLRALAVTTSARLDVLPDVPTVAEFVPGYEASGFAGIGVPRGTPVEIINLLNKELNAGLASDKIRTRIVEMGGTVMGGTPAEFAKVLEDATEKWAKVIKAAGIKAE
jgi:tripartite-type tricarboxylate transporter receptor subunit TctC